MLTENTLNQFVHKIGTTDTLPGGGSVAAYNGSLGASLTSMVAVLTVGKEKYAEFEELNKNAIADLAKLVDSFQKLIDEDALAYTSVVAAFGLSKSTEEEQTERYYKIQDALKGATLVPFEVMELSLKALEITESLIGKSNKNASGDLIVAALNLNAALLGSYHNVCGNLESLIDDVFRNIYLDRANEMVENGKQIIGRIQKALE